ncbi:VOC family protein [Lederbergia wuyishanensis]|uniref:Enzyme related to lactoylglutathione lyase n=1 Tax=Lederbergia wuyishanensis TaxID=1347903 RepID=A0ABU0D278_9BACI|nr:VOC family protein [Lederbergia wuyishanensis]MCJ8007339.1 VOC family protein [Lederbergia wuyishanensis]MDQ0342495.1 putative enzyme related to lactoylglutathione lyase [Lederbergia wuyishanensis]
MSISLNLVVIKSKNLEESVAFYKKLGLLFQKEQHGNGPEHYACELGQIVFEIFPATHHHNKNIRLGFSIKHIESVIATLKLIGAEIVTEPKASPWGKRAVVKDPDGNSIELIETEG